MTKFAFYTTEGCHLCEQAWALIIAQDLVTAMTQVEIIHDEADVARYGIRIPVIKNNDTGKDIGWPFDAAELADFIKKY
ncbi:glutaredoxin family protein [Moritella sp. Urea-trap-13]|uniref:glutaredoxin family protein n=1 Tax=Moritella sp. Urea-trap-13 TaxID=2058327 RepID=UPI000C344FDE|nr:glutaredoxin family protein [Moritella sp. Urea-trap-13]PKH06438.1 NrdH-redoxin [Moritella sp. Urea-trap-13]